MSDLVEIMADAIDQSAICVNTFEGPTVRNPPGVARAALTAIEKAGHRIVPVEPDEKILLAILMAQFLNDTRETYAAMLAAAPKVTP